MTFPAPSARKLLGTLYRGTEPLAHDVEGLLVLLDGIPAKAAVCVPVGMPDGEAARLVGSPLTLASHRGPMILLDVDGLGSAGGRPVLLANCRVRTLGPPLELLDEAEVELGAPG